MDPKKETKGNAEIQNKLQKIAFDGLIIRVKAKKESVSFKIGQ